MWVWYKIGIGDVSLVILTGFSICGVFFSYQTLTLFSFFLKINAFLYQGQFVERTKRQKSSSASVLLGVTFVISPLYCMNIQIHTCLCMLTCTQGWHWFWSKHALMCRRDGERAHNLTTLWLLAQIRTIKNRPRDNEPGWHNCSWRSNSKDVSQPPLLPHLIWAVNG